MGEGVLAKQRAESPGALFLGVVVSQKINSGLEYLERPLDLPSMRQGNDDAPSCHLPRHHAKKNARANGWTKEKRHSSFVSFKTYAKML